MQRNKSQLYSLKRLAGLYSSFSPAVVLMWEREAGPLIANGGKLLHAHRFQSQKIFFFCCLRASAHPLLIPRRLISVSINSVSCVLRQQLIAPLPSPSCEENPSFFAAAVSDWSDPSTVTEAHSRANINKVGKSCGGLTALPGDSANLNPNSRGAAEGLVV